MVGNGDLGVFATVSNYNIIRIQENEMITTSDYETAVSYLENIPRFNEGNTPDKTRQFVEFVGDISKEIPIIHVAGTNGKGSVCAFCDSILRKAGYKTGMFTSPHLVKINERFVCDGKQITDEEFVACFGAVKDLVSDFNEIKGNEAYHPNYFEFLFVMSLVWYKKVRPDVLILETGLGGRLDATNTLAFPKVCVITEIGMDHMEYLGDTVEKIAAEKAGIIKPGTTLVYVDKPKSGEVIAKYAESAKVKAFPIKQDYESLIKYSGRGIDFSVSSRYYRNVSLKVENCAYYQVENATVAVSAIEALMDFGSVKITVDDIVSGVKEMFWPGRMEPVCDNLIVDGAHNPDGIGMFITSVSKMPEGAKYLMYSAVSDKQIEEIAQTIIESGLFERIYVPLLSNSRAAKSERLKASFEAGTDAVTYYEDVDAAMRAMLCDAKAAGNVMCYAAGSLYLVGEVKRIVAND